MDNSLIYIGDEKLIKMYHIDMNRIVRGVYNIFKFNELSLFNN